MIGTMLFRPHILLAAAALWLAGPVCAQTAGSAPTGPSGATPVSEDASEGCDSGIAYGKLDDPLTREERDQLTREERVALLDQAFFDSLARFERCSNGSATSAAKGGSGADGGGAQAGQGTEQAGQDGGGAEQASVPSNSVSGTESDGEGTGQGSVTSHSVSGVEVQQGAATGAGDQEAGSAIGQGGPVPTNRAPPADIPSADNDSILEAQIRSAALAETDPEIQARLWNEYRKYKNLPPVSQEAGQSGGGVLSEGNNEQN